MNFEELNHRELERYVRRVSDRWPLDRALLGGARVADHAYFKQIAVAAGERLSFADCALSPRGHAIEFRINAEDPVTFQPSPGRITTFHPPGGLGVRVDTAAYQGYLSPPHYDSLIAMLSVSGRDRAEAIARGRRALDLFVVEGVKTSIPMHRRILEDPDFVEGKLSTRFMERFAQAS